MKFVPIDSARKLKIDEPVFIQTSEGKKWFGKLIKEEKTKDGVVRTFQLAFFHAEPPFILETNVTHVAIP